MLFACCPTAVCVPIAWLAAFGFASGSIAGCIVCVGVGLVHGYALTTFINCLLYFSGYTVFLLFSP